MNLDKGRKENGMWANIIKRLFFRRHRHQLKDAKSEEIIDRPPKTLAWWDSIMEGKKLAERSKGKEDES